MIHVLQSRRGSAAVFLTVILAAMLIAIGFFIHAAAEAAGRSYADAVLETAGRSVLSEYDVQLQKRYGIFAVHTDEGQAESKIRYYSEYSFHENAGKEILRRRTYKDLLRLHLDDIQVDLKGYALIDADLFEKQILEDMKTGIFRSLRQKERSESKESENRILKNEKIIVSLPSNGYQASFLENMKSITEKGLPDMKEVLDRTKDRYLVDEYILKRFYNHSYGNDNGDTFFRNEAEYILKGNFNDASNYREVRMDLFLMRNVLNLAHIINDRQKMEKIKAVAAVLSLIKGEEVGIGVITEAWAAAESENDLRLLEAGKEVALVKGGDNWAVPLSNTLEYIWKDDYYTPSDENGYDYENYLRILLYLEDREEKLLRCMDLIQMNLKGSYYSDFDIKEYYCGFQCEAVVQGNRFYYEQKY